jgi:hypothetical protein
MRHPTLLTLAIAVALAGCGGKTSNSAQTSQQSASQSTIATASPAVSVGTPNREAPYPDWAAAAVPDYPNIIDQTLIRDNFYEISSADETGKVLSWYRAHVSGIWATPGSPDNSILADTNGVRIEIDKIGYGNQPAGNRPKTTICLNRIVNGQADSC